MCWYCKPEVWYTIPPEVYKEMRVGNFKVPKKKPKKSQKYPYKKEKK